MNLIVAVDSNWAIGKENKLLVSIPQDMKFFRETTKGKVVAMGRKTLESFPGGQPLKNRVNVVLTTDKNYKVKDTVIVHTIEEMVDELKKYDSEDIFVIGGESIYRQLLPYWRPGIIGGQKPLYSHVVSPSVSTPGSNCCSSPGRAPKVVPSG